MKKVQEDIKNRYNETIKEKDRNIKELQEENYKLKEKMKCKQDDREKELKKLNRINEQNYNNNPKIKELIESNNQLKEYNNKIFAKMKEYEKQLEYTNIQPNNKNIDKLHQRIVLLENELKKERDKNILLENELKKERDKNNKIIDLERQKFNEKQFQISERENDYNENRQISYELESNRNVIKHMRNKDKKGINNLNRSFYCNRDEKIEEYKINKNLIRTSSNSPRNYKENEPIKIFFYPTLIGLNKVGDNSLINSILQCLSQTESLTNYFLKDSSKVKILNNNIAKNNKNALQLSRIYLDLIEHLWSKNENKAFSPKAFMNIFIQMNPSFKTEKVGDYKSLIFILEQLHKELYKSVNNNINTAEPLNQYDRKKAFQNYFNDFQKECSIISDVFFGINENTNICQYCKKNYNLHALKVPICYNYGKYNCLIFPSNEVKKMKNNSNQSQNNRVSIYECFIYNKKSIFFTGPNKNYCNMCKQKYDSIYTSEIYISPNVLILILDRGKLNIDDLQLDFEETIDITNFIACDIPQNNIYDLYGVITQIGQSDPNTHFIASCKSPVDNNWYNYNDSFVSRIKNVRKDVLELKTPYILFYKKRK